MADLNGLWFDMLRKSIDASSPRGLRGLGFIPKGARLSDFGFDMRPIRRPGVLAHKALPTIRARWNSNVRVFQSMLDQLAAHGITLSAPPLTPKPFNMSELVSLFQLMQHVHRLLDAVGGGSGALFTRDTFTNTDEVAHLLVSETLASHLLALQLHCHVVDELPNLYGPGSLPPWIEMFSARLITRTAGRSRCTCTSRESEVFGKFTSLLIPGEDQLFIRETIEWVHEVKNARQQQPGLQLESLDPRCWFNQLAMLYYPEQDYAEAGWEIRRWYKSSGARRSQQIQRPCLCPRVASTEMRQEHVLQLPDTFMRLCVEADEGLEALKTQGVFPHGWEMHRDHLAQWEGP